MEKEIIIEIVKWYTEEKLAIQRKIAEMVDCNCLKYTDLKDRLLEIDNVLLWLIK